MCDTRETVLQTPRFARRFRARRAPIVIVPRLSVPRARRGTVARAASSSSSSSSRTSQNDARGGASSPFPVSSPLGSHGGSGHRNRHPRPEYRAQCSHIASRSRSSSPASPPRCAISGQCAHSGQRPAAFSAASASSAAKHRVSSTNARTRATRSRDHRGGDRPTPPPRGTEARARAPYSPCSPYARSPPYLASFAIGAPRNARCARIWCVRPVLGSHFTSATPRGASRAPPGGGAA